MWLGGVPAAGDNGLKCRSLGTSGPHEIFQSGGELSFRQVGLQLPYQLEETFLSYPYSFSDRAQFTGGLIPAHLEDVLL